MPNHVSNRLTITGDPAEVKACFEKLVAGSDSGVRETCIDFNNVIRKPAILDNTSSGVWTFEGVSYRTWWTDGSKRWDDPTKLPDRPFTTAEQAELRRIGYDSWYGWCCHHWGTKWNAYDQKRLSENAIYFETAWSAPLPVMEALAAQYPLLSFRLDYADEDRGSNAGILEYAGGELVRARGLTDLTAVVHWHDINDAEFDESDFEHYAEYADGEINEIEIDADDYEYAEVE